MKFSESWLRTLVAPELSSEALSHLLTMAGLEVEELDPVAPQFNDVVVAHVLEVTKHPDADRLNVCKVDTGRGEPTIIVCGAPNVAVGLRVPCALPGVFVYAAAFVAALAILVVIHELGHFLVARAFDVKVLRFAFGFGKVLWVRRFGADATEWAVCAVPLGGAIGKGNAAKAG